MATKVRSWPNSDLTCRCYFKSEGKNEEWPPRVFACASHSATMREVDF